MTDLPELLDVAQTLEENEYSEEADKIRKYVTERNDWTLMLTKYSKITLYWFIVIGSVGTIMIGTTVSLIEQDFVSAIGILGVGSIVVTILTLLTTYNEALYDIFKEEYGNNNQL